MLNLSLPLRGSFRPSEWTFADKKNTSNIFQSSTSMQISLKSVSDTSVNLLVSMFTKINFL